MSTKKSFRQQQEAKTEGLGKLSERGEKLCPFWWISSGSLSRVFQVAFAGKTKGVNNDKHF